MGRLGLAFGAAFVVGATGLAAAALAPSWRHRVAVAGHSMEPGLRAGDWLLVDPGAYRERLPATGELVVARDPRAPRRLMVKRVSSMRPDGHLLLAGDHPAHADDTDRIGPLPRAAITGRPWLRYWPLRRAGLI